MRLGSADPSVGLVRALFMHPLKTILAFQDPIREHQPCMEPRRVSETFLTW
jgi:hypothetical protein